MGYNKNKNFDTYYVYLLTLFCVFMYLIPQKIYIIKHVL